MRLAEPLAALSLVSDMARGRPAGEAMRACLVATDLARSMGVSERGVADVYYTTLLRSVGCTATSHEYAALLGGDDLTVRGRGDMIDPTAPLDVLPFLWDISPGRTRADRVRAFAATLRLAKRTTTEGALADCEIGARMARRFGLAPGVESALLQVFERWDGKGPGGAIGENIALPARYAAVAYAVVMFEDGGTTRVREIVGRWAGHSLDPGIAAQVALQLDRTVEATREEDAWLAVVAAEPEPYRRAFDQQLDDVAGGFADVVDLKSPFFHGHSRGVAALAASAAGAVGLGQDKVAEVRRAGLLHDLGRAGIPTGIWEKPGALTTAEWEQVRLHPYHTERILGRAPALAPLARLAGMHHERLDGSGYHRGAPAAMQDLAARLLAAADVYQALTEDRPHRPGLSPNEAARALEGEALDHDAVRAVIEAAGQTARRARGRPAGITDRELDIVDRLVRGRSEKEIAAELVISPATVHSHVAHIYEKTGVSTRAGLAMFAMEHDLIRPGQPPRPGTKIH